MTSVNEQMQSRRISWWQVFRLIFVIFSLYLIGDAFYRWDGFKYYASFAEFLPSVALATVLWSILAGFASLLIYLVLKAIAWLCIRLGLKIVTEHVVIFSGIVLLMTAAIWAWKRLNWPHEQVSVQLKQVILLSVVFISVFLTWLFRKKSENWIKILKERITPLVWIFCIWLFLSVNIVVYQTWIKKPVNKMSGEITRHAADTDSPNIILVTFDALTARNMS
jgi:hypothetical protein